VIVARVSPATADAAIGCAPKAKYSWALSASHLSPPTHPRTTHRGTGHCPCGTAENASARGAGPLVPPMGPSIGRRLHAGCCAEMTRCRVCGQMRPRRHRSACDHPRAARSFSVPRSRDGQSTHSQQRALTQGPNQDGFATILEIVACLERMSRTPALPPHQRKSPKAAKLGIFTRVTAAMARRGRKKRERATQSHRQHYPIRMSFLNILIHKNYMN
jgi:hypothetical protein